MGQLIVENGLYNVKPIKNTSKIEKPLKSQNLKRQSKFNYMLHTELKRRGVWVNL